MTDTNALLVQEIGSWVLAVTSLAGSYFIGNKRRGAWLWMFFTQLIWVAYGALTHQNRLHCLWSGVCSDEHAQLPEVEEG